MVIAKSMFKIDTSKLNSIIINILDKNLSYYKNMINYFNKKQNYLYITVINI